MIVAGPDPADTLRIEVPWTLTSGREGVNGETSVPNVKVIFAMGYLLFQ